MQRKRRSPRKIRSQQPEDERLESPNKTPEFQVGPPRQQLKNRPLVAAKKSVGKNGSERDPSSAAKNVAVAAAVCLKNPPLDAGKKSGCKSVSKSDPGRTKNNPPACSRPIQAGTHQQHLKNPPLAQHNDLNVAKNYNPKCHSPPAYSWPSPKKLRAVNNNDESQSKRSSVCEMLCDNGEDLSGDIFFDANQNNNNHRGRDNNATATDSDDNNQSNSSRLDVNNAIDALIINDSASSNNGNVLHRSNGAAQTFTEIFRRGEARDPLPDTDQPNIDCGVRHPQVVLLPSPGIMMHQEEENEEQGTRVVYLMKETNPDACYMKTGKPPKKLGWGWGVLEIAVRCHRAAGTMDERGTFTFQMPSPQEPESIEYVAIKTLRKSKIQDSLNRGYREDPYKEILRMQQLGDGIHVLPCIEALEDDRYLYIVTPYCQEGDLWDNIPWAGIKRNNNNDDDNADGNNRPGYPEEKAKQIFEQILKVLFYLECHGICHHDISPGNFLFYKGRLLLADFAMSFPFPKDEANQRYLTTPPTAPFGTKQYQAPDTFTGAFSRQAYDGVFTDLWSVAVILYNLLTGQMLYRLPHPTCVLFRYYLLAQALSRDPDRRLLAEFEDNPNIQQIQAPLRLLSQDAMELLENLLQVSPFLRWNLDQARNSRWLARR